MEHLKYDLTGKRFGMLTVLERVEDFVTPNGTRQKAWKCLCDCGNITISREQQLTQGRKVSCGCKSSRHTIGERTRKHGMFGSKLYSVWGGIIQRCTNPQNTRWAEYGGRGISVCDEWRNNPENFCEWARANGYEEGLQIDRIDTDKGYSPENCRWITRFENTARAKRVPWPKMEDGCRMLLDGMKATEVARKLNVHFTTVYRWRDLLNA